MEFVEFASTDGLGERQLMDEIDYELTQVDLREMANNYEAMGTEFAEFMHD
jgi:hypothetical protein